MSAKATNTTESRGVPNARAATMNSRNLFLAAARCEAVPHPPVWLMRQAGRALPEYRTLKEKFSFLQLVQTPELAAEVTLQPIRRFAFDAAILFSDILVVCEGLGQRYKFRDEGGIAMDFAVRTAADVAKLDVNAVVHRLQYVAEALKLIRSQLGGRTALLGFAGAPWTLANFMIEGGSSKDFAGAKAMFYNQPELYFALCQKLTEACTRYLQMQIDAGVDAIQIFDTLGGSLSCSAFQEASGRWIKDIIAGLQRRVPIIVFSKGTHGNWDDLVQTGANVLGADWGVRLSEVAARLPKTVAVQGNLDPFLLSTTPEAVVAGTESILADMKDRPGHIFNLGHGVTPESKLECIQALVDTVRCSVGSNVLRMHAAPAGHHPTAVSPE
jgi:uroporphyrinogen decarboxylase